MSNEKETMNAAEGTDQESTGTANAAEEKQADQGTEQTAGDTKAG